MDHVKETKIRPTLDFSYATLDARKQWSAFKILKALKT